MLKRILVVLLLLLGLSAGGAWMALSPYQAANLPVEFTIQPNQGLSDIAHTLEDSGAIRHAGLFMLWAKLSGNAGRLKAGDYRLNRAMSMPGVMDKLVRGETSLQSVIIREGWTLRQFRAELDRHPALRHDTRDWSEAELLTKLKLDARHGEGLFFPDTYLFLRGSSDILVLRQAAQNMRRELERAWAERGPDLPYASPYEALIMASLIEKETGQAADRPMIARVFLNRLKLGMRLQTDPSVIYGLGEAFDGNLTRAHLQTDTPYNTYTRAGLTPTPIALPGRAALEAAANPAPSRALYFVARGDGTSQFSETLDEHNAAVRKYILGKGD